MSHTPLTDIDHFVHIWFHKEPIPEFDARLKQRLDTIAWNVHHIVNFVDESMYFPEDLDELQIVFLAQSLTDFIHLCHLKSCIPMMSAQFDAQFSEIPDVVLKYLQEVTDGIWQKVQTPVAAFEQWKQENRGSFWELPADIKAQVQEHDSIFITFMSENFQSILDTMSQHFAWHNIYDIKTSSHVRNDEVANRERKQETVSYALKLLWEQRVIFSGMRDGDMNRILWALNAKENDAVYERHLTEAWITLWAHEKMYGNAHQYVLDLNRNITLSRANSIAQKFFDQVKTKWFSITPGTNHWIVGEYYGRCVQAYGSNLLLYRFKKEKTLPLQEFSLVHPSDVEK